MRIFTRFILAATVTTMALVAVGANASTPTVNTPEANGSRLVKVVPASASNAGPDVTVRVEGNQTIASSQQVYLDQSQNRPEDAVITCRKTETLGSRLRAKRVCKSAAQWRGESNQARENVNRINNNDRGGSCLPGALGC
jgi:hypothetical protein